MFQWRTKNKHNAKNSYSKIDDEFLIKGTELESENQPDSLETQLNVLKSLLETQLNILPQPFEEISKSSDENIIITNGEDLLETQLNVLPQPSEEISKSSDENIIITNGEDLLETQLNVLPQPSEEISKSSDENIIITNGEDLLETQLNVLPQPSEEISKSSDENIIITNGGDLLETQLNIFPQPSEVISKNLEENTTITNRNPKETGISFEVIEFVKKALEVFFIDCYISCDLMEICDHPELMIAPTEFRDYLMVHNRQQNNCKMYQCSNKHASEIIFIFLTFEETSSERKYYITSPSHILSNNYISKTINCSSVDITDALNETPIAVAKLLRYIQTGPLHVGLYGGSFTWIMIGTEECFKLSQGVTNLLWSTNSNDNESSHHIIQIAYRYRLNTNFDFRIVRELTPKQCKTISIGLDKILTDFKIYLYNSNVQKGIFKTENTILKTAVLVLEKNPSFKLVPSYMGIDYGVFPTNYNVFICINQEDTCLVKFLFQWYTSGRYYVTSPFHTQSMTVNSRIPCVSPVDITDALKYGNIADALFGLTTREDGHVFTSNNFNWNVDESEGSFVVSSHEEGSDEKLYWTVCESEANIQLRDKEPTKLRIKLIDLA